MKKLSNKHKKHIVAGQILCCFTTRVFMECSQVLGSSAGVNVI